MRRSLFSDWSPDVPPNEGIKYAGSKLKLLPSILALSKKTGAKSIFDSFSGSTRVSQAFAQLGYRVISNDLAEWSRTFGTCYLKNAKHPKEYQGLIDYLNPLLPEEGWFTENYSSDVKTDQQNNAEVESSSIMKKSNRKCRVMWQCIRIYSKHQRRSCLL